MARLVRVVAREDGAARLRAYGTVACTKQSGEERALGREGVDERGLRACRLPVPPSASYGAV